MIGKNVNLGTRQNPKWKRVVLTDKEFNEVVEKTIKINSDILSLIHI